MSTYVVKSGKEHIVRVYTDEKGSGADDKFCTIPLNMTIHHGLPLKALREIRDWAVLRSKRVVKDYEYTYRTKCGEYCGYIYQTWFFVDNYLEFCEEKKPTTLEV
jgi:hypothetical protein